MTIAEYWTQCRIAALRDLAPDIREFRIAPAAPMPRATPGSHLPLRIDTPAGPLFRTYSLLDGGGGDAYRIAVRRVPVSRGGSAAFWRLAPGDTLEAAAPRNDFPLLADTSHKLLIAGGIGITALAPMAIALQAAGADFHLVHAVRHRTDLALHDELAPLLGTRLSTAISSEGGRIDFAARFANLPLNTMVYLCGPLAMLNAARAAWADLGRKPADFRFETFGTAGSAINTAFHVRIPRLGREIPVAADQSLLDALEGAGIAMISGCRKGECGLCALRILATDHAIDHRDVFLSADEQQQQTRLCTCVSRVAGGTLVLDTADRESA